MHMQSKHAALHLVAAGVLTFALASPAQAAYTEGDVKNGGSITGAIKFEGTAPAPKVLSVNKDKDVCGKAPIKDESLVVKDGGVVNAVVMLKDVKTGKKWGELKSAQVDQKGCVYHPRVVISKVGDGVVVLNSDGVLHNIHTHPEKTGNPVANIAQPKFRKKLTLAKRYFAKPGIVKLTCDVHDWMTGYAVIAENPYAAVTGDGGKFEIKDVPAGTYTLEIWHETLGTKSQKVEVKSGAATAVNVSLKK
jgi:plastocyanin